MIIVFDNLYQIIDGERKVIEFEVTEEHFAQLQVIRARAREFGKRFKAQHAIE